MTDDDKAALRGSLLSCIEEAQNALGFVEEGNEVALYDHLKIVHDAAIAPWCLLVKQLEREIKPTSVQKPRVTTDELVI